VLDLVLDLVLLKCRTPVDQLSSADPSAGPSDAPSAGRCWTDAGPSASGVPSSLRVPLQPAFSQALLPALALALAQLFAGAVPVHLPV
jgi:hypothetical protein